MTDTEYFQAQLSLAYTEAGNWQAAMRQARSPERIKYCQEEIDTIQKRIDRLCDKLNRISRDQREGL